MVCREVARYSAIEVTDHPSACNRIAASLRVFRVRNLVPGLVAPGLEGTRRRSGCNVFDALMIWPSAVTNVANLGNFSPTHGRKLNVQVSDELANLWWQRPASFSRSALLPRREQALHPRAFKRISFAGQRALGDIDFLCSLPCGFVEKDEGSDLLIEFLLRPQRPLLDTRPLIRPLAARSFRPRHLPLPFAQTTITSSVPDSLNVCKDSREF